MNNIWRFLTKTKLLLAVLLLIIVGNVVLVTQASAQLPIPVPTQEIVSVPETTGWLMDAWKYLRNKVATIMFQNIARKVLNDFAFDAGTYLGSRRSGQKAVFIEEKWTNFWDNVGDQAVGEFIESFANSVIAYYAADERNTAR